MAKTGDKNNSNTTPTLEEYITNKLINKRAAALTKSRNRTLPTVPLVERELSPEEIKSRNNISYIKINQLENELIKTSDNKKAAIIKKEINKEFDNLKKTTTLCEGLSCIYTATDNYGSKYRVSGNKTFAANPSKYGFKKIPNDSIQPSDLVQITSLGFPSHAMIFDSKDEKGENLYNYSTGGSDKKSIRIKSHNPTSSYNTFRFVGTPADSTQWINEYKQIYGNQMKCGGRRKAQLGLDIREGGIAIPIAPNMYYMDGRSHDNGGIAIGPNNKNGLEVEGGEVVKVGKNDVKVFSSVPLLRGVSPAQLVLGGANPNKVFRAQEDFKDRNRINDDGTTYKTGGLSRSSDYGSKKRPYPNVKSSDFAGGHRSYPIPTKADAIDALRLAGLHGRSDVKAKVYRRYPELRKKAKYGIGMIMPPNITISKLINSIKFDRKKIHNRIPAREWRPGGQSNVDKDILVPFGMFSILNQYYNNKDNVAQKLVDEANKIISNPWSSENEVNDAVAYLAHDDAKSKYLGFPQRTGMVIDSNYKPTKAKNKNTKYYKFAHQTPEYWDNQNGSVMQDLLWQKSIGKNSKHYIDPTLNEFTGYIATDPNKGDYISIYDKWDYNKSITGGGKDNVAKHIPGAKLFEIYDRIYLDDYYGISSKAKKEDYYGGYLPEVEVKPKKKKYGGNMIYEINGNVKNGLMSLRPKAQFGKEKKINSTTKIGADGLIYTWGPDGNWYTDGTRYEDSKYYMREKSVLTGGKRSDGSVVKPKQKTQSLDEVVVSAPKINKQEKSISEKEIVNNKKTTNSNKSNKDNKGIYNSRPQYYAEKRLPIAGSKSIAEKAGLARSGWSYADDSYTINGLNYNIPSITESKTSAPRKGRNKASGSTTKAAKTTTNSRLYEDAPIGKTTYNRPNLYIEGLKNNVIDVTPIKAALVKGIDTSNIDLISTGGQSQFRLIGQYKPTSVGDWIGLGSNVIGSLASYFINKDLINKLPMPQKPVMAPAAKLKTRYNIEPQLTESRESELSDIAAVERNVASSNVAATRRQRISNRARQERAAYYGQKENIETQLINQDRLNRQSVIGRNVAAYNDWLKRVANTKLTQSSMRSSNINNLISGLAGGVGDMLSRIESRRATNNTLRAISAANPNVDARLIGGFDYYTDMYGRRYDKNGKLIKR